MKEKAIDSTFEKKTQEKGQGRVIYQPQTESGSQAGMGSRKCSILIGLQLFKPTEKLSEMESNIKLFTNQKEYFCF